MHRNRRLIASLTLLLPVLLWLATGWSAPTGVYSAVSPAAPPAQDPKIQAVLSQVTPADLSDMVGGLSGAHPVTVGGQPHTFTTRYTPSEQGTLSEQYVYEYFQSLGLPVSYHEWSGSNRCSSIQGRNVVAEIGGKKEPGRVYLLTAHLDSISPNFSSAPGADDDGSGTAAVMLAARILMGYSFEYTLRFVVFTGEERGLCGSGRYAADARARNEDIRGVLNLDMIGYDSDGKKDIELHAGTRPDSRAIADLFAANVTGYGLNLVPHLLTDSATNLSDHASFWNNNYPAIVAAEYLFSGDGNPFIHSVVCCDTVDKMDFVMAADMAKAAIATLAMLGGIEGSNPQPAATQPPSTPTGTSTPLPVQPLPGSGSRTFPETGKAVNGLFLDYWQHHGALSQQGYPISNLVGEVSDLNGRPYTVQYFERAVFEYHPENQPPFNVLLSQLGAFQYKEKYPQGAPNQRPNNSPGSVLFRETGKRVGGKFLDYWQRNGGLMQQGFPISDEFTEVSDLNGRPYTVQYFERAVMEQHPENQPPFDVLLSQLGAFEYRQKHGK